MKKKTLVVAKLLKAHVGASPKHSPTHHVFICGHGSFVKVLSNLEKFPNITQALELGHFSNRVGL